MNKEEFIKEVKKLGIEIDDDKLNKLDKFYNLLIEWNEKINVTTITKEEDVYLKHFYDSLTLIKGVDLTKDLSLCDVGTGAGFPGIVLKICFPNLKITLIDSLRKRVIYLNEIIKELDLKDIEAYHYRMEDYSKINEEKFDIITARAVSNTKVLCEISVKALKVNGQIILMKANIDEELSDIDNMLKELNLSIPEVIKFKLPKEDSNRSLIIFKKLNKTKDKYPRNIDKIKKNSL